MTLADGIVIAVIALLIIFAAIKLVRERKKGAKCVTCVGCPYSGDCSRETK